MVVSYSPGGGECSGNQLLAEITLHPAASCSPDKGNIFHSMRQILLRKQTNLFLILQNYFMLLDKYYVLESGY